MANWLPMGQLPVHIHPAQVITMHRNTNVQILAIGRGLAYVNDARPQSMVPILSWSSVCRNLAISAIKINYNVILQVSKVNRIMDYQLGEYHHKDFSFR